MMDLIKNIFNILFFASLSIVAVLSYLQARKTLFTPIKTEIFKLQMESFQEVIEFFNKNNDHDFNEVFGFREIFDLNAANMHRRYIKLFFFKEIEIKDEDIKRRKAATYGAIYTAEEAGRCLTIIEPGSELKSTGNKTKKITEPALMLAEWNQYSHDGVVFTKRYHDETEKLKKLASSPLLPKELADLMHAFLRINHNNLGLIGVVVARLSKEMPTLYSTAEDVVRFDSSGMWGSYIEERENLDNISSQILKYINEYLKINKIMA